MAKPTAAARGRRPAHPEFAAAMARSGHNFKTLAAATGIHPVTLSRVYHLRQTPSFDTAIAIAKELNIKVTALAVSREVKP